MNRIEIEDKYPWSSLALTVCRRWQAMFGDPCGMDNMIFGHPVTEVEKKLESGAWFSLNVQDMRKFS